MCVCGGGGDIIASRFTEREGFKMIITDLERTNIFSV